MDAITERMAWHYTSMPAARAINATGWLLPTPCGLGSPARFVAWFTLSDQYDRAARPQIHDAPMPRPATHAEMRDRLGGIARYGAPVSALARLQQLQWTAGLTLEEVELFELAARRLGSNSRHWYCSIRPLPVWLLAFEVYTRQDKWQRIDGELPRLAGRASA